MPNKYTRKRNVVPRATWSADDLHLAITAVICNEMSLNEAAHSYNIPKTTLKRRIATNNLEKTDRLGPDGSLGKTTEEKLSMHIKKLQKQGFAPTRTEVRKIAFNLAELLGIRHKFKNGKAGRVWLQSFLRRNPDISVRKAENTSVARAIGMSREIVSKYFTLLQTVLAENELFGKPGHIFNTDETGLQLNTRPEHVLAEIGSKSVPAISPGEKGETISVIACCSAEGVYLPPYCIFKGKNRKNEWAEGTPPGSQICMSEKSAYVNSKIFLEWLTQHFFPRKPPGKVLLMLDGHTSHTTNIDALEFAERNEIIIFCFPPHCTHYLQPLDRAFFKSLKGYFYEACRRMVLADPNKKINRLQFGKLLGDAWGKSATVNNAVSAFKATGISPYHPDVIPDYAFLLQQVTEPVYQNAENETLEQYMPVPDSPQPGCSGIHRLRNIQKPNSSRLACSGIHREINNGELDSPSEKHKEAESEITPGKALDQISPVPKVTPAMRKVRVNLGGVLSSPEYIGKRKQAEAKKKKMSESTTKKAKKRKPLQNAKTFCHDSSSTESEAIILDDSSNGGEHISDVENECIGCMEDYRQTKKKDDWIKCILCLRWLHEGCTSYIDVCQKCGADATKKKC